jgi:hypothetical protein
MINNIITTSSSTTSRPSSQTRNEITKKDTGDTNSWYRFTRDTSESDSKSPKERERERKLFLESLCLARASPDSRNFREETQRNRTEQLVPTGNLQHTEQLERAVYAALPAPHATQNEVSLQNNFYPQDNFYLRGVCSRVPGPLEYETSAAGGEQPDPPQTNFFAALAPTTQINSQLLLRRVPLRPHSSASTCAGMEKTKAHVHTHTHTHTITHKHTHIHT